MSPLSPFQQGALSALRVLRERLIADREAIEIQTHQDRSEIDVLIDLLDTVARFYEAFDVASEEN